MAPDYLGRLVGFRQGKYVNDGVAAEGARFQHTWELDVSARTEKRTFLNGRRDQHHPRRRRAT